ncbi:LysR family transcriptional regulator [Burkholderia multivorans]|uniref:LysR family transcriptional regulator n=1 Tax=Burkholderia multivorans TaxID=87883 RepID=UPI0021BFD10F|nr:LysR family transcriptional regulator [Burkholderia multivorans]
MNWDDLRYFLDVARTGRLTASARRLGVEHTTVARRIQSLEKALGAQLFSRSSNGYELTDRGMRLLQGAEEMERAFAMLADSEPSSEISGLVRIGCNEGYGTSILPRHVAKIMKRFPQLSIDVMALPRTIHLPRNEAEIVITIDRPERGPYIVSKLSDYELRLYASPGYLAMFPAIVETEDLAGHAFINYITGMVLAKNVPNPGHLTQPGGTRFRSTSILSQRMAAQEGLGIAILSTYLVDGDTGLVEVLPDKVEIKRSYWITMHSGLKNTLKFKTVWQMLRACAQDEHRLLNQSR